MILDVQHFIEILNIEILNLNIKKGENPELLQNSKVCQMYDAYWLQYSDMLVGLVGGATDKNFYYVMERILLTESAV